MALSFLRHDSALFNRRRLSSTLKAARPLPTHGSVLSVKDTEHSFTIHAQQNVTISPLATLRLGCNGIDT